MQARGIIFLSSFYLRTDWLKRRTTERKCSNPLANLGASRQGKCLFMPFTVCEHAQNCMVSSKATAMNWMSWPQARPSLYGFSSDFFFFSNWLMVSADKPLDKSMNVWQEMFFFSDLLLQLSGPRCLSSSAQPCQENADNKLQWHW